MVRRSPCLMGEVLCALTSLQPQSVHRMCVNGMFALCKQGGAAREEQDFLQP
jgi:hypothetical protein